MGAKALPAVGIALLLFFAGCEYLKRQPADDAARQLEGVLKKDREIEQQYKRWNMTAWNSP